MVETEASEFLINGMEATHIKFARNINEIIQDADYFHPVMCHQVYSKNEMIFGYRKLKIRIIYDARTFKCLVQISFDKQYCETYDNAYLLNLLNSWLPENYFLKESDFIAEFQNHKVEPPTGKLCSSFKIDSKEYVMYVNMGGDSDYEKLHKNMESLIVWFIDAANFIDIEDTKWQIFVAYEKVVENDVTNYYPVGYCTVYEYYAYPDSRRYRISQFIIFPPYQGLGIGTKMLKVVLLYLPTLKNICDITVEDPNDKFQRLRDYIDCNNCMKLESFTSEKLKGNFNSEMTEEAKRVYKINSKQCRRIYEILKLYNTNVENDEEFSRYKQMVKSRLNAPFKREEKKNLRVKKDYPKSSNSILENEQRILYLQKAFHELMTQYKHVISRLHDNNYNED